MELLKKIKSWFISKPLEELEVINNKPIEDLDYKDICCFCESEIKEHEIKKKFNGSYFHKPCFKKMKKDIKRNGLN